MFGYNTKFSGLANKELEMYCHQLGELAFKSLGVKGLNFVCTFISFTAKAGGKRHFGLAKKWKWWNPDKIKYQVIVITGAYCK